MSEWELEPAGAARQGARALIRPVERDGRRLVLKVTGAASGFGHLALRT